LIAYQIIQLFAQILHTAVMLLLHLKVNIILFYLTILLANFRPIKSSADLNYANQLIGMYFKDFQIFNFIFEIENY